MILALLNCKRFANSIDVTIADRYAQFMHKYLILLIFLASVSAKIPLPLEKRISDQWQTFTISSPKPQRYLDRPWVKSLYPNSIYKKEVSSTSKKQFSHYHPDFVSWLNKVVVPLITHPSFIETHQKKIKKYILFQLESYLVSYLILNNQPKLKNKLLTKYRELLASDSGAPAPVNWITDNVSPQETAFWLRRMMDGSAEGFAKALKTTFLAYDANKYSFVMAKHQNSLDDYQVLPQAKLDGGFAQNLVPLLQTGQKVYGIVDHQLKRSTLKINRDQSATSISTSPKLPVKTLLMGPFKVGYVAKTKLSSFTPCLGKKPLPKIAAGKNWNAEAQKHTKNFFEKTACQLKFGRHSFDVLVKSHLVVVAAPAMVKQYKMKISIGKKSVEVGPFTDILWIGDLNHDQYPDFILSNNDSDTISNSRLLYLSRPDHLQFIYRAAEYRDRFD